MNFEKDKIENIYS